eukprot:83183-Rhodomonas_salina.1
MGELVEDEDQGEGVAGLEVPRASTTRSSRPFLDPALKQNARWDAAGGGMADGYVVTQIPGVDGAIGSKDQ